jgi:hypothetical protein
MLIQPQVGPLATTSSLAAGQQPAARAGNMGELIVSELHGRYYEAAYRKTMFSAANQAGATTTVGLATTYTGICLSNPINSTVNLVVQKVGYAQLVAFTAAAVIAVAAGYNSNTNVTHTTPVTPRSNYFNNGTTGQALVDVAATLPTAPVYTHVLGTALTGADHHHAFDPAAAGRPRGIADPAAGWICHRRDIDGVRHFRLLGKLCLGGSPLMR